MARIKGAVMTRKRRKKTLKLAKGYFGAKSKRFKMAKQAVMKSGQYAYIGRKQEEKLPLSVDHPYFGCLPHERCELLHLHERSEEGWHHPEPQDAL